MKATGTQASTFWQHLRTWDGAIFPAGPPQEASAPALQRAAAAAAATAAAAEPAPGGRAGRPWAGRSGRERGGPGVRHRLFPAGAETP